MKNLSRQKVKNYCILVFTFLIGSAGIAQITQRGTATTAQTGTSSSLTINKPAGVIAGDVLIANIVHHDSGNNFVLTDATSSGWTVINGELIWDYINRSWRGTVMYRIADGSEGSNFTFSLDGTTNMAIGSIIAFDNVDVTGGFNADGTPGGPFDVSPVAINVNNSNTPTATSITTANNNAAIIMLTQVADNNSQTNWNTSSPGTLTELYDNLTGLSNDAAVAAAWAIKSTAGATGNGTSRIAGTRRNGALLIALKGCTENTITLSSAVGTVAQTICVNSAITDVTYVTTGATGATFAGLPTGVTGNWAAGGVTISGTPTVSGSFNYTITLTGGCGNITSTGTLTVNPNKSISLSSGAGTNNQTSCVNIALSTITFNTVGVTAATFSGLPTGVLGNWAANVVTISGTPTVTGSFPYTITLIGGCGPAATATGTITVNANISVTLSSGAGTNNQTRCINTAISNITFNTTNATGATFTGLPAGVTGNWVASVVTISGTPTSSGTFPYTVTLTGGCGPANASGTITVTPNNTITLTSAAGTNAQTRCINTAITNIRYTSTTATGATFTGLPTGVTGTWAGNIATISGTPSVAGLFNYTVTLIGGCGSITATGTIAVAPNNTISLSSGVGTNNQTVCVNTAMSNITFNTITATGATFSGLPAGVTGTLVANVVTISGTPTASGIFNYTVTLTGGCGPVVSVNGTINVSPMTAVTSTTPGSRTSTGTVNLGATASLGTLNWFSTLTGGVLLGSGTSFTTPTISATTTFYVEAVNGACTSSPRTPVIATVNNTEIDVLGNATSIVNGDVTPSASDWTDFGTTNTIRTFTIRNTGFALLTVGTITISGANASEFNVTTAPASAVGIGGSTTFVVTFTPTAIGIRTATISIVNNDADENPYTFAIQGNGVEQEIDILGNGVSIVNGDSTPTIADWTDFNNVAGTRTFTIRNAGSIALSVGAITISGAHASDFSVTTLPASSIGAYSSTTFVVTFNPYAINARTATISIANDDFNENPYNFSIQGFGIMPEIDIQGNATSIAAGDSTPSLTDWTDFSSTAGTRTFTIFNNGNLALAIGAITISGPNASEFTVTTTPSTTVAAFSSTSFVVTFLPTAVGTRSARINIVNNDSNENPYAFSIQGTGVPREIDVQGFALSIARGDMVTSVTDGTDFGSADVNLATITRTFTIRNTGSLPLTISNPTISGLNAAEFSVTTNPGTLTIGAGSSTTFSVTFNPSAVFTRVAQINIVNNDSDENPYFFAIQGKGFLDNDGDGIENNIDLDDDNDGVIDTIECGSCSGASFQNGSFENPVIAPTSFTIAPSASVPGWTNSAEPFIELWSSGFNGVPAATGNQFAELNANVAGTLYQSFCLNGAGGTINWSIKHRGRAGVDRADVRFGATLALAQSSSSVATMIDGNTAWGSYSGTYTIPVGQTNIVLAFVAVSTATGSLSVGNFIDDVEIIINQNCIDSDGDGIADINDIDDDNDGIPTIEEAGFKAFSNNKSTMDRSSAATWVDANANGLNDYIETMITNGTYNIPDTDGDGVKDYFDLDSDNDSIFDVDEAGLLNGDGDINGDGKGDGLDSDGDGLLNLFDNSTVFGTTTRAYAQDSDVNGIADYLQLDSNDDGLNDIKTGLYGSLDANNDGRIDGSGDADGDGIIDTFDTNTTVIGSPRDLNRKLYLDFDGRNDYAEASPVLGGLPTVSVMAWVNLAAGYNATGAIVGQNNFYIRITDTKRIQVIINGASLTHNPSPALNNQQWYHIAATYNGNIVRLYLNGQQVQTLNRSGNINSDSTPLTIGRRPGNNSFYFKGKIDEVRVFDVALTAQQLQRMVYQEIQNNSGEVRGAIIPKDIESLPYANLLRYYRMDAYKDDIVDDLTTPAIDQVTGMKMYNHKNIAVQQAPMPFETERAGTFAQAANSPSNEVRGLDVQEYDYAIIRVNHNISETVNHTNMGMLVDNGVTIVMDNESKLQNDWYVKLDGKIDLVGRSQFVQTEFSDLEPTSTGSLERDQQGQSNRFNYNYWSSPVSSINSTTINHGYTVAGVMKDGTNPANPLNMNWVTGINNPLTTNPITLSSYWIFKFQNLTPDYANWASVGQNGILLAGQGYTMKGSRAATAEQNYVFVGKPNNGPVFSTVSANNLNLSGNPYPSALDSQKFIQDNIGVMNGTLYFWEHFSTNNTHVLSGYQGGYAARTMVGGTAPVSPAGISGLGTSTRIPGRFIPVGQGFFVTGNATGGDIRFDNSQRFFVKENNASSSILFRNGQQTNSVVTNLEDYFEEDLFMKIRVGFNSYNNFHRQLLIGFMDDLATEEIDPGYDAIHIDNQQNDMYFLHDQTKLTIQGASYFDPTKTYALGIKTFAAGDIQFTLDGTENVDPSQAIYIHDNVTGLFHDIREEHFTVNLPLGEIHNRFFLTFQNGTLSSSEFELQNQIIVAHTAADNLLTIKNTTPDNTVESVSLYTILGQTLATWNVEKQTQNNITLPMSNVSTGTYIVRVQTTLGTISKKIIIK